MLREAVACYPSIPILSSHPLVLKIMERLYAACSASGRLADATFDFMKKVRTLHLVPCRYPWTLTSGFLHIFLSYIGADGGVSSSNR